MHKINRKGAQIFGGNDDLLQIKNVGQLSFILVALRLEAFSKDLKPRYLMISR